MQGTHVTLPPMRLNVKLTFLLVSNKTPVLCVSVCVCLYPWVNQCLCVFVLTYICMLVCEYIDDSRHTYTHTSYLMECVFVCACIHWLQVQQLKEQGNKCMEEGKLDEALEHYDNAIDLDIKNHVLFSNRWVVVVVVVLYGKGAARILTCSGVV